MKIELLAVNVRPRKTWEAIDLGLVMVRHWCRQVYVPWLLLFGLFALPLLFGPVEPALAILIIWWFRPLLSRVVLFVLSREMFGVPVSPLEALKAVPGLIFKQPFFLRMTLCRFSFFRGVLLPVWILEGVKGQDRSRRESLIRGQLAGPAFGVTLLFQVFEWLIFWPGLLALCFFLLPAEWASLVPEMEDLADHRLGLIFYILTTAFFEPFYMAVCFSLYLNCRTILEGWDLELSFRRIAGRIAQQAKRFSVSACLISALFLGQTLFPAVHAQDTEVGEVQAVDHLSPVSPERVREEARKILESPPFNTGKEEKTVWRLKDFGSSGTSSPATPRTNPFGVLFSWLMWGVAALALVLVIVFVVLSVAGGSSGGMPDAPNIVVDEKAPVLHALIEAELLPDDIPSASLAAFEAGDQRLALSLLFRGALLHLAESGKLALADFATEGECLAQVNRKLDKTFAAFFQELVGVWQRVAYGHQLLPLSLFQEILRGWKQHLGVKV